ncbi:hypothetical protein C8R45DRAFT_1184805 [Mycena sanguinolenta]|nr:hypothetical protein C8R45DRAFT_1184805 [Mycena sanguinolenta]
MQSRVGVSVVAGPEHVRKSRTAKIGYSRRSASGLVVTSVRKGRTFWPSLRPDVSRDLTQAVARLGGVRGGVNSTPIRRTRAPPFLRRLCLFGSVLPPNHHSAPIRNPLPTPLALAPSSTSSSLFRPLNCLVLACLVGAHPSSYALFHSPTLHYSILPLYSHTSSPLNCPLIHPNSNSNSHILPVCLRRPTPSYGSGHPGDGRYRATGQLVLNLTHTHTPACPCPPMNRRTTIPNNRLTTRLPDAQLIVLCILEKQNATPTPQFSVLTPTSRKIPRDWAAHSQSHAHARMSMSTNEPKTNPKRTNEPTNNEQSTPRRREFLRI